MIVNLASQEYWAASRAGCALPKKRAGADDRLHGGQPQGPPLQQLRRQARARHDGALPSASTALDRRRRAQGLRQRRLCAIDRGRIGRRNAGASCVGPNPVIARRGTRCGDPVPRSGWIASLRSQRRTGDGGQPLPRPLAHARTYARGVALGMAGGLGRIGTGCRSFAP